MTTPLNLDALQALCDAATPEPWFVDSNISSIREGPGTRYGKMVCALYHGYHDNSPNDLPYAAKAPNLAFIATARSALPALIQEVRRLQARVQQLQGAMRVTHQMVKP